MQCMPQYESRAAHNSHFLCSMCMACIREAKQNNFPIESNRCTKNSTTNTASSGAVATTTTRRRTAATTYYQTLTQFDSLTHSHALPFVARAEQSKTNKTRGKKNQQHINFISIQTFGIFRTVQCTLLDGTVANPNISTNCIAILSDVIKTNIIRNEYTNPVQTDAYQIIFRNVNFLRVCLNV